MKKDDSNYKMLYRKEDAIVDHWLKMPSMDEVIPGEIRMKGLRYMENKVEEKGSAWDTEDPVESD